MDIRTVHRARPCFKSKTRRRFVDYFDPLLGPIEVSEPSREPGDPEQGGALVICDSELGDLVCSPAAPGNPRRTLAPPVADPAFICFVAASIACTCLAACGLALAAGR